MNSSIALVAMTVFATTIVQASAASQEPDPLAKVELYSMHGTCDKFRIDETDSSSGCDGMVLSTTNNGFVDFYFSTPNKGPDESIMTFSGRGERQIKINANTVVQPVDRLLFHFRKDSPPHKAVGSCFYENPWQGKPATIDCTALIDGGTLYSAHFVSDGTKPVRVNLK